MVHKIVDGSEAWEATGIVNGIFGYTDGKRDEVQAVNEDGLPLWAVLVTRQSEVWGRQVEEQAEVTFPSKEQPVTKRHAKIVFRDMEVSCSARLVNGKAVHTEKRTAKSFVQPGVNTPPVPNQVKEQG